MKNLTSILSALIAMFFVSCSASKSETAETTESFPYTDVVVKNNNSLLWKIESPKSETSYLYGTMHMINEAFYDFPEKLSKRIGSSDEIIMEIDGIPNPFTTISLMSLDSGSIHDYFSSEQMIELLSFMDNELGMDPKTFDETYGQMKPFVLLQGITQNYFEPTAKSQDLSIMSIANEKDIQLTGLETIEEQLGFFDQIPSDVMAKMIIESTRDYEKEKKNTLKLMELYFEQKVEKLIPLLEKSSPEFMEYEDLLLYDRNKAWIPKIITEIASKKCFIAVGAGHLFGEKGVIALLEQEGYVITPISTAH